MTMIIMIMIMTRITITITIIRGHHHVSTGAQKGQMKHWLKKGNFAFIAATAENGEMRGI